MFLSACQSVFDNVKTSRDVALEAVNEEIFLDQSNLWSYIANQQKLEINNNPRIQQQLGWFKKHPDYLTRISERAQPYLYLVVQEIEKEGLPIEIALLPIVESAYYPFSYSHGTAVGVWQFIPSTGRLYGLDQDWWHEDRRHILNSTRAAARYLKDLGKMFNGDWMLAVAAYNAGPGRIQNAVKINQKAGKQTDYWSLDLPKETEKYVPKLLALSMIAKEPEKFGQQLTPIDNSKLLEVVELNSQFDLALIAQWTGLSIDEIYTFNPGLRRWATPVSLPYELLLPVSTVKSFEDNLEKAGKMPRISWLRHQIKSGDSLIYLAKKYKTTVDQIRSVNELQSDLIRAGEYLIVPLAQENEGYYSLSEKQREKSRLNTEKNAEKIIYKVVSGDSLWKIAVQFDTTVNNLVRWNQIDLSSPLRIDKELVIWVEDSNKTGLAEITRTGIDIDTKITYMVRAGDNLSKIASKYSVKVKDVLSWNNIKESQILKPGQKLLIKVNVINSNLL
jgi:membrane-bound lytic murein transglycosylase D